MDNTGTLGGTNAARGRAREHIPGGSVALGAMLVAWVVALWMYLQHRIVISPDSVNNYAHVWWIADGIWHQGTMHWHMPVLGHGQAYTYPYGIVNWTTAAFVWPLFGDWGVTLWTALGAIGCVAGTFAAFPEMRRSRWLAAAVLANPAVWYALVFGQQSFEWGAALLLFGVAAWRHDRRFSAALLIGLGQANHPAVVLPIGAALVGVWLIFGHDKKSLVLRWYALSLAIALPEAALVLLSPAYTDSTTRDKIFNFFSTVGPRLLIVALPIAFVVLLRRSTRLAPAALVGSLVVALALWAPMGARSAVRGFVRKPPNLVALQRFLRSDEFKPNATYRVLRGVDKNFGLYYVLRHGGRLDSEFFPESAAIRSFASPDDYANLLCSRHIDFVLDFDSYDRTRHTNEHLTLRSLARGSGPLRVTLVQHDRDHDLFAVDRRRCPTGVRTSPDDDARQFVEMVVG